MDDRFSFGTELEEEPAEEKKGSSRVFLIIAIGLVGLIALGLLSVAYYFLQIRPQRESQVAAQATQVIAEATAIAQETALAPTDTPLPTLTPVPTSTPIPTPTPKATYTPVLRPTETPDPGAAPTPTRTPMGGRQTPPTGMGGGLTAVLAAVGLAVVIFVTRKLRLAS